MTKCGEFYLLLAFLLLGTKVCATGAQKIQNPEVKPPHTIHVLPAQVIKPTEQKETPKKAEALEMAKAVSTGGLSLFFLYKSCIMLTQGVKTYVFGAPTLGQALLSASLCSIMAAASLGSSYFLGKQCRESLERLKVLKPRVSRA